MDRRQFQNSVLSMAAGSVAGLAFQNATSAQTPATKASPNVPGMITEEQLGNLLAAMGLKPKKEQHRYDFEFKAVIDKEEWVLTMSAVLSQDKKSIWLMAWLDELPKSAADVPRTALLRLLARNDKMGNNKFFAYIATNRRFVLEQIVPNKDITTAGFRDLLKGLSQTVVETYPEWSVSNWSGTPKPSSPQPAKQIATPEPAAIRR